MSAVPVGDRLRAEQANAKLIHQCAGFKRMVPLLAKVIAGASLFLWLGVIYFGRLIPEGLRL